MFKLALHADDRLKERTQLHPSVLRAVRARLAKTDIPRGAHHVRLGDGYAVVVQKPHGDKYVATVLSSAMTPPGRDLTRHLAMRGKTDALEKISRARLLKYASRTLLVY